MTRNTSAPGQGDRSPKPTKEELNRLLIEEFYKDSVARYGSDSEQASVLSRHLTSWRFSRATTKSD
jgi:hypothetical protein